ncbi:DUF1835 domain-containing protein [Chryseobacterium sp. MMS23-Vi53]|uniref:DUF1835 domain-containing protein n=1 Tax=Chryseobacterium sp. MMS23-Vi53 TaxID=3386644 RepID=UPI0039EAD362
MNQIFNILNGDCLADQLKETTIGGAMIVCKEALVIGPLFAENLNVFWKMRSEFIAKEYHVEASDYFDKTFPEFEMILNIPDESQVNLWFEDDLFCLANMWFCISLLSKNKRLKLYRIFPKTSEKDHWKGFSVSTNSDLEEALQARILFKENDIDLALQLWKAYQSKDRNQLKQLSKNQSDCFHFLDEVIEVYLNNHFEVFIKNLVENGTKDFNLIFEKFQKKFAMLGFGDLQVKSIYDKILKEKT